jgi:hypothetical protein
MIYIVEIDSDKNEIANNVVAIKIYEKSKLT